MTDHEMRLLDQKIEEVHRELGALARLRDEVKALERRGNKEQAFFAGRRSMAYELRESGGLSSSRLGQEILFLLPDDFVQFYGSLFHRALNVGDGSVMGAKGKEGLDKAKGNTGTVLGSDTRLQAAGSGKKFRNTPMAVGSEAMLKLKASIDKELQALANMGRDSIRIMSAVRAERMKTDPGLQGLDEDQVGPGNPQVSNQCLNGTCRGFLKASWHYCPRCGTRTGGG